MEKDLIGLAFQWNKLDSTDTVHTIRKSGSWEGGGSPWRSISDTFQTRLQDLYSQDNTAHKESDFMKLSKEWNNSGSTDGESDLVIHNETIFVVGNDENVRATGIPKSENGAEFQARLKSLYGQTNEPDKKNNFIALPKE